VGQSLWKRSTLREPGFEVRGANLVGIMNWRKVADIKLANVYGVKNPPEGFLEWAMAVENGAISDPKIDDSKACKLHQSSPQQ